MKKFLAFLLASVTCLSVAIATSCKGKSNNRGSGTVNVEVPDKNVKATITIGVVFLHTRIMRRFYRFMRICTRNMTQLSLRDPLRVVAIPKI